MEKRPSKEQMATFKKNANDMSLSAEVRAKFQAIVDKFENVGEAVVDAVEGKKVRKPRTPKATTERKPRATKQTADDVEMAKAEIKKRTGKTEEECESIIEQYKALRTKSQQRKKKEAEASKSNVARINKLKDDNKVIEGTTEKTADAVIETTTKDVAEKIEKQIEVVEKKAETEAKKEVEKEMPKVSATEKKKEVEKKVEEKVKAKTKTIVKRVVIDTSALLKSIAESLGKFDKDSQKEFLIKLRSDIDKLLTKYSYGGMTDGATQIMNITQSNMSSSSVNSFGRGGKTMYDGGGRIKVGVFDENQLRNKEDKKAIEKAQKETGLTYIDSKIIKKGGKMFMEVYLIPNEEYYNSSKFSEGGGVRKYGKGGLFGESAKLEYVDDAFASDELKSELQEKLGISSNDLGDNVVISFAYTDYGGDFLDKVAIRYFQENYPENTLVENTSYNGENAYVFGEPAKEWIESTEDYPLGFENIEELYYEMQNESEYESFEYFLDDLQKYDGYVFDKDEVMSWLMENRGGYYSMTTQGLDFSSSNLTDELVNEGLVRKEEEEFGNGGSIKDVIVYDNGGETFDRYTIFTPDGSVYGMSDNASMPNGFNQYLGDDTEVEKGSHLGKRLKSVPKSIEKAVVQRMNDSYAKGGMTEHGLRIKDTILGDYGNDTIVVRNSMGDMERVNLNEGKRFEKGGGVEGKKYKVINKRDKNYGKVGVNVYEWKKDKSGVLYTSLQFPNGSVSTYSTREVEPFEHYDNRFSEGGGVDLFSMSKTINDRGQISEMVIAENVSVDEFNKLFSDKGYRKVNDNSLVGFYFAKPNGDTIQLIPSFHKKGEIIKYAKGGGVYNRSWHFDRARHNKNEKYEVPMNRRKKAHGGTIEERMRMRRGM